MGKTFLQSLEREYGNGGDLELLLRGLSHLDFECRTRPDLRADGAWLFKALEQCVRDCMRHQPVNRTNNRLAQLEAREEDDRRLQAVSCGTQVSSDTATSQSISESIRAYRLHGRTGSLPKTAERRRACTSALRQFIKAA